MFRVIICHHPYWGIAQPTRHALCTRATLSFCPTPAKTLTFSLDERKFSCRCMTLYLLSPGLTKSPHPFSPPVFLSFTPLRDVFGHRNPCFFCFWGARLSSIGSGGVCFYQKRGGQTSIIVSVLDLCFRVFFGSLFLASFVFCFLFLFLYFVSLVFFLGIVYEVPCVEAHHAEHCRMAKRTIYLCSAFRV